MAREKWRDADFGYVGSGPGKITLYKGKEVVKRNVPSEVAVDELITLLKENDALGRDGVIFLLKKLVDFCSSN
jgi:(E)-4-hydroxy-3-methylbut-2-enyl-diphosphate synthase